MSVDSGVNLIMAALDLKLVQLVRRALTDDAIAHDKTCHGVLCPIDRRHRIDPEPVFEPRERVTPTPHFEPRPVFHPTPRFEPEPLPCEPLESDRARCLRSPLEPPWKTLPWENPPVLPPKIKVTVVRPDIVSKGSLIDFFV